ncbi:MAG: hypothetical protein ACRYFX_29235 [Janthinobacterium lividum]
MKERPILFSGPMVQALLAGAKTQTRRIAYPRTAKLYTHHEHYFPLLGKPGQCVAVVVTRPDEDVKEWPADVVKASPHGQPGDRLWVREAWRTLDIHDELKPSDLDSQVPIIFEADGVSSDGSKELAQVFKGRYRSARFMMRHQSRLLLEITAVRCERLQDISEADAVAEGIEKICDYPNFKFVMQVGEEIGTTPIYKNYLATKKTLEADPYDICATLGESGPEADSHAVASYKSLWESINGPDSWGDNPWVWVVEFKVVEGGARV